MKRTERHHLKEHELDVLAREARQAFQGRKRETTFAVAAIVIVGAVLLGYVAWRDRIDSRAEAMLAGAVNVSETRVGAPIAPGTPGAGPSFPTERARGSGAQCGHGLIIGNASAPQAQRRLGRAARRGLEARGGGEGLRGGKGGLDADAAQREIGEVVADLEDAGRAQDRAAQVLGAAHERQRVQARPEMVEDELALRVRRLGGGEPVVRRDGARGEPDMEQADAKVLGVLTGFYGPPRTFSLSARYDF